MKEPDVSACSMRPSPYSYLHYNGASSVAGVATELWVSSGPIEDREVHFAPLLGCLVVKDASTEFRSLRMFGRDLFPYPVGKSSVEAVRIELGNPPAELFTIPAGFRKIDGPTIRLQVLPTPQR